MNSIWVVLPIRHSRADRTIQMPVCAGASGATFMPRYLIEREFPAGLHIPQDEVGATLCHSVIGNNAEDGVTWLHSYVTPDNKHTFCIYDGPSPEAVRRAAARNKLPITHISEVRVLDPYFYRA
jgi:Protein of unknown function (DUF4242)